MKESWLFRSTKQKGLLRDRNIIATGPFGFSIAATCLGCAILASVIYGVIWALEGPVLYETFGFEMPLAIKISSLISTLFLYSVVFPSLAMTYMLTISSLTYLVLHIGLLSGLMVFYYDYLEDTRPIYGLMYHDAINLHFVMFLTASVLRLIVSLPLAYYVFVLATIRINGGTGWERRTALELEKQTISTQLDNLKQRKEWVNMVVKS
ncbi:olfactory receptor 6B1-like [Babesia ovis]|uniref:Olfactory receptor 6B1-like n=1 Tax=Babesia ovis TaxID=5869 RepID=A0A9W5WTS8_BABOV|nr:olfactory receptor 6B1-like [Babesia ovis]